MYVRGRVGVSEEESQMRYSTEIPVDQSFPKAPSLRRSDRLLEKYASESSLSSVSTLLPDIGRQHVPYSYSLPCSELGGHGKERPRRKSWMNGRRWPNFSERADRKTSSVSPPLTV